MGKGYVGDQESLLVHGEESEPRASFDSDQEYFKNNQIRKTRKDARLSNRRLLKIVYLLFIHIGLGMALWRLVCVRTSTRAGSRLGALCE